MVMVTLLFNELQKQIAANETPVLTPHHIVANLTTDGDTVLIGRNGPGRTTASRLIPFLDAGPKRLVRPHIRLY
jgi:hypothetical protein